MKDPANARRPSSRAAGVDRWQALERDQFLALVAAPAQHTFNERTTYGEDALQVAVGQERLERVTRGRSGPRVDARERLGRGASRRTRHSAGDRGRFVR